jgi:uncharacterized protein with von Willebrand factor type A (vWA) domain
MQKVIDKVNSISGGTRIGASLEQFAEKHAPQTLHSKTLVFILSDGWDTGAPELLSDQMRMIHRRAMKVIWLNPLAGNTNWQPEVVGMQTAMPFIDLLLPFHNVENIKDVVDKI